MSWNSDLALELYCAGVEDEARQQAEARQEAMSESLEHRRGTGIIAFLPNGIVEGQIATITSPSGFHGQNVLTEVEFECYIITIVHVQRAFVF